MKIRRSLLCFVWLCLTLGFSLSYTEDSDGNLQDDKHQDDKQQKQQRAKIKIKKKKEKPPVILPPPTVYQYRPLSKTRRLLNKIRMGPSRLLKTSKTTTNKNETNLELLQNQYFDHDYNPRLGFEMAVLSGLSYWEFHKKDPPQNATGFALLESTPDLGPFRKKIRKYRTKFRYYRRRFKNKCSTMIRESVPMVRSLKRRGGNTTTATTGDANNNNNNRSDNNNKSNKNKNPLYTLEYSFYNWHEPTNIKGVSFHDTDVLISTANNGNTLIIAFAGSASPADVVTNVQTFEPANHSLFFEPKSNLPHFWNQNAGKKSNDSHNNTSQTQGSLHRGFLNAYSRVERGHVLRIQPESHPTNTAESDTATSHSILPKSMRWWRGPIKERHRSTGETKFRRSTKPLILDSLNRRFGHCHANASLAEQHEKERIGDDNYNDDHQDGVMDNSEKPTKNKKRKKKKRYGGCKVTEKAGGEPPIRLSLVLKELVETALSNGYQVHITGHSLGGALGTLLVLDVLANENIVELDKHVNNLYLWTFGAPQIADLLFWESLLVHSPKLRRFLLGNVKNNNGSTFRQYIHRYVTLGDDGKVDAISEVAKNTLAAHKESSDQLELTVQGKSNRDSHDNSDSDEQTNKKKWPDAIHGKFAQSIGGISSGSEVTHFIDAHYLWTPDQQQKQLERNQQEQMKQLQELGKELMVRQHAATKQEAGEAPNSDSVTDTRSSMHAHSIRNYLMGISRESGPDQHPLIPDLPLEWLEYLEIVSKK